jgi:hypothetical protein
MKIIIPILIALLSLTCASSKPYGERHYGKIAGQVVSELNEPIPGASIIIDKSSVGTAADYNGYFCIDHVLPGIYSIIGKTVGFRTMIAESLTVIADSISIQKFTLETLQGLDVIDLHVKADHKIVPHYSACESKKVNEKIKIAE